MSPPVSLYMTTQPLTIGRRASLAKAHALMRVHGIRHLPVIEGGRVVGIVSREDLHELEALGNLPLDAVDVDEAMTRHPYVVSGDTPVDEVAETMARHKYGCAIVTRDGAGVEGIFTTVDALHVLVELLRPAAEVHGLAPTGIR